MLVDVAQLVPAHDLAAGRELKLRSDEAARRLDFHPGRAAPRRSVLFPHVDVVPSGLARAEVVSGGQIGYNRSYLLAYERALTRACLDQPRGDQQLDSLSHRAARDTPCLGYTQLGRQLIAGLQVPGLDFLSQAVSDAPVRRIMHRRCHRSVAISGS